MQFLPLFLLMMAVLIAAYFYLERAKVRDGNPPVSKDATATAAPAAPTDQPAD